MCHKHSVTVPELNLVILSPGVDRWRCSDVFSTSTGRPSIYYAITILCNTRSSPCSWSSSAFRYIADQQDESLSTCFKHLWKKCRSTFVGKVSPFSTFVGKVSLFSTLLQKCRCFQLWWAKCRQHWSIITTITSASSPTTASPSIDLSSRTSVAAPAPASVDYRTPPVLLLSSAVTAPAPVAVPVTAV